MRSTICDFKAIITNFVVVFIVGLLLTPLSVVATTPDSSMNETPHRPGFVESIDDLVPITMERQVSPGGLLSPTSTDIDIVELIEQLDEELILGYLENLTAFGPRVTGTPACELAGYYLYDTFQDMGLEVRFHNYTDSTVSGSNVEATLYGTDGSNIFIVCAHYDSVSGSPGADDDGSGVAAVLAAASIMSSYQFAHTVRFVTFSGEEQGLIGSRHYAHDAFTNNDSIVAVLNADMIGFALTESDGAKGRIYHNPSSNWIVSFSQQISVLYDEYIGIELIPQGETWGSDHYYFWQYGFDAVFYHEWKFNSYYHSPGDTIENMNLSYCTRYSRLILATLAEMALHPRAVLQLRNLKGGLGFSFDVMNIGNADALDVNVTVSIKGGLFGFVDFSLTEGRPLLGSMEVMVIKSMIFRFGPVSITIIADASNAAQITKKATGFIVGPFVLRLNSTP